MNQRILKKLAKKSVPVLQALNKAKVYRVEINAPDSEGVDIGISHKFDRKHYDRNQSLKERYDFDSGKTLVVKAKCQNRKYPFVRLTGPSLSWPGVPYCHWKCSYEYDEYEHEDTWSTLFKAVEGHYHELVFKEDGEQEWGYCPNMRNPRRVFKLAQKMLSEVAP